MGQEPLQCSAILRGRSFTSTEALINEYKKHFAAGHSNFHRELFCIVDDVGDVLHCFTDFTRPVCWRTASNWAELAVSPLPIATVSIDLRSYSPGSLYGIPSITLSGAGSLINSV